jgi:DNA-binding transcriptional LysR family regulator
MAATPAELVSMVCFARVVEAGTFTAAAGKLGLSKSAVSARVAELEDRLGARLLNRTTRRLSLTSEGLALYERCAPLLAAADAAAAAAEGAGDEPRGVLRVNAPVAFAEEHLAAPLAATLERHPGLHIELSLADRVVDLVGEGVDVAVRVSSRLEGGGLVARKLCADRTVLVGAPVYLGRRGTPAAPAELLHHDCLVYSLLRVADEWRFRAPGRREVFSVPIEGRFAAASGAVLRRAALAGMGLAVLPTFMIAGDLAAGHLRRVLADAFVGAELGIYAVYPQARRTPAKVRAFVDVLAAHFRKPSWAAARITAAAGP